MKNRMTREDLRKLEEIGVDKIIFEFGSVLATHSQGDEYHHRNQIRDCLNSLYQELDGKSATYLHEEDEGK